ncbi:hypothetical protein NECID01_0410 [Nematocida sp. AWRm77]|nr:hypothetical protein NECID01_0410 [Nematocida sp. AWRm77]
MRRVSLTYLLQAIAFLLFIGYVACLDNGNEELPNNPNLVERRIQAQRPILPNPALPPAQEINAEERDQRAQRAQRAQRDQRAQRALNAPANNRADLQSMMLLVASLAIAGVCVVRYLASSESTPTNESVSKLGLESINEMQMRLLNVLPERTSVDVVLESLISHFKNRDKIQNVFQSVNIKDNLELLKHGRMISMNNIASLTREKNPIAEEILSFEFPENELMFSMDNIIALANKETPIAEEVTNLKKFLENRSYHLTTYSQLLLETTQWAEDLKLPNGEEEFISLVASMNIIGIYMKYLGTSITILEIAKSEEDVKETLDALSRFTLVFAEEIQNVRAILDAANIDPETNEAYNRLLKDLFQLEETSESILESWYESMDIPTTMFPIFEKNITRKANVSKDEMLRILTNIVNIHKDEEVLKYTIASRILENNKVFEAIE